VIIDNSINYLLGIIFAVKKHEISVSIKGFPYPGEVFDTMGELFIDVGVPFYSISAMLVMLVCSHVIVVEKEKRIRLRDSGM